MCQCPADLKPEKGCRHPAEIRSKGRFLINQLSQMQGETPSREPKRVAAQLMGQRVTAAGNTYALAYDVGSRGKHCAAGLFKLSREISMKIYVSFGIDNFPEFRPRKIRLQGLVQY